MDKIGARIVCLLGERKNKMVLFKMELYKVLRRPIVWVSGMIMALLLGVNYIGLIQEERSTIGTADPLFHMEAIRQDREIVEEFQGVLTNEKLQQIVDKYGFPSKTYRGFSGWWDKNFLTEFVTEYFSDGYYGSWDNYKKAETIIPIENTNFYPNIEEKELYFEYNKGWTKFIEFMQFAGYALIIWLVIVLSPLFAQDYDTNMYSLIFTTENGYKKDINSKILAAFTVTLVSFLAIAGSAFAVNIAIYGLDGAQMLWCFVAHNWLSSLSMLTMAQFTAAYLLLYGLALFMTCAFCVLASALSKNNFTSLLITSGILILPLVYRLFGGSLFLCVSQPMMMILADMLVEAMIRMSYWFYVCAGILITIICTFIGRAKCRKQHK